MDFAREAQRLILDLFIKQNSSWRWQGCRAPGHVQKRLVIFAFIFQVSAVDSHKKAYTESISGVIQGGVAACFDIVEDKRAATRKAFYATPSFFPYVPSSSWTENHITSCFHTPDGFRQQKLF
jgi:hypothetical protein